MEISGLLEPLRLFQFTETASHVTERSVRRKRLCVESTLRFFRSGRSLLNFFGVELGAIFRRENLSSLQVFFGVDVLGFFLLRFFARAFLLGGVGDILSTALRSDKNGTGKDQEPRKAKAQHSREGSHGCGGAHGRWGLEISSKHKNRPRGDTA